MIVYVHKCAYLCFSKILFIKTGIRLTGQSLITSVHEKKGGSGNLLALGINFLENRKYELLQFILLEKREHGLM